MESSNFKGNTATWPLSEQMELTMDSSPSPCAKGGQGQAQAADSTASKDLLQAKTRKRALVS